MPTLNINGQRVTVGDEFLSLPPEQQNATVDEIAKTLSQRKQAPEAATTKPEPDKYRSAAMADREKLAKAGVDTDAGLPRIGMQGATFNTADEILAGLTTPLEMIRNKTWNPAEGYRYAKAKEDLALEEGRKKAGWAGTAADIAGGIMSGSGLARTGLSVTGRLAPEAGLLARSLAGGADAAAVGTVAGAAEGNSLDERGINAATGGLMGFGIGTAAPVVSAVAGKLAAPFINNYKARQNPQGYAKSQVARAISESGRTPQQIADDIAMAAREGQDVYAVADALGNPGQRMLSSVTRAPGSGRTAAVDFLEGRQAGQGRRIANALSEGFDSPQTAAQTQTALTRARDTAADAAYGAVRADANPVDLSATIRRLDETLSPGVNQIARPQSGIANDSVESALQSIRSRLTDGRSVLSDFTAIQRVRGDLSDQIQAAVRQGAGNKARLLGGVMRELDSAMEAASAGHRAANANYAQASRTIDAVDQGRTAAMRGRPEDTIPAFRRMTPDQQAAYRAGYVDPLIEQTQSAAVGVNKARPFTSDAFRSEAAAITPLRTGNQMSRRLARENMMFETRNAALGGSKTADNLADEAAVGADPAMIANLISGNWLGAAKGALVAGYNKLSGNTPQVREEIGRILTMRGGQVTPAQMQAIVDEAKRRVQADHLRNLILGIQRGAGGGLAVAPSALNANGQ